MAWEGSSKLNKNFFEENEKKILKFGDLSAKIFRYSSSGVYAVRIENNLGYIIILPYMGQQIWEAVFNNRNITMKTTFTEPAKTDYFLYTYGVLLIYCGALRMGCPGPEDNHLLHGELPCARYRDVQILFGENEKGKFIGITGIYEYNVAFGSHYQTKPVVRLYEDSSIFDITMEIDNLSCYPMELMYMTHINLRPVENGRIVQSLGWNKNDLMVRESIPSHVKVPDGYIEFINKLKEKPELTRVIKSDDVYRPEVVFSIGKPEVDKDSWAHFMQIHPDSSGDYVSYKPKELDHGSRWFCINEDKRVLGLLLPATADAEGYIAENKKGNIKEIPGKGSRQFNVIVGYLNKRESEYKENYINNIMSS